MDSSSGGGRRRVASIPPRRKDGSGLLPDFDYATNIRATGEFYHTSAIDIDPKQTRKKWERKKKMSKLLLHNCNLSNVIFGNHWQPTVYLSAHNFFFFCLLIKQIRLCVLFNRDKESPPGNNKNKTHRK
jgi:hypothetical protein